jgi:hypothetical protein
MYSRAHCVLQVEDHWSAEPIAIQIEMSPYGVASSHTSGLHYVNAVSSQWTAAQAVSRVEKRSAAQNTCYTPGTQRADTERAREMAERINATQEVPMRCGDKGTNLLRDANQKLISNCSN